MNKTFTPNLPSELKDEILVNLPYYMTLQKNSNKKLFYDKYCHKEISVSEFINYYNYNINCLIYTFNMDEQDLPEFTVHIIGNNTVYQYILYINNIDIDEYVIGIKMYPLEELDDIKEYLSHYNFIDIYFDTLTTFNILKTRSCREINPKYAFQETIRIIESHTPKIHVDDLYSFFDALKKSIYLESNYGMMKKNKFNITLFGSYLEEFVFNSENELISDNEEDITDLIEKYNLKEYLLEIFYL
jgi:hypothetical protein